MKTPVLRFVFLALFGCFLTLPTVAYASPSPSPADRVYFCALDDYEQWRRDHPRPAAKWLANLNVGEPRTVQKHFVEIATAAGIEDARLHDLRRTVMTRAAASGVGTHVLRDLLGHKTTADGRQIYPLCG